MACERLGVAASVERFDEMHEADEVGLSAALVVALERASGDTKARAASRDGGDCSVCMEPLDASRTLGGFVRMTTPTIRLPCGHEYHGPCVKNWLARRTTCPCCREEVTEESIREMAAGRPFSRAPATNVRSCG